MGKRLEDSYFYNEKDEQSAIFAAQKFWPKLCSNPPKNPDELVGKKAGNWLWVKEEGRFHLGVRAIFLAIILLYRLNNTMQVTASQFKPMSWETNSALEIDNTDSSDSKNVGEVLARLLVFSDRSVPHFRKSNEHNYLQAFLFKAIRDFHIRIFHSSKENGAGLADEDKQLVLRHAKSIGRLLIEKRPQTIDAAFTIIKDELLQCSTYGSQDIEFKGYIPQELNFDRSKAGHVIPEKYLEYLKGGKHFPVKNQEHDDGPIRIANKIFDHMCNPINRKLGLLVGHINSGKSAVLVELLRILDDQFISSTNTVQMEIRAPQKNLPVMICNIRQQSNRDTTIRVLAFLNFQKNRSSHSLYKDYLKLAQEKYSAEVSAVSIEKLRLEIATLHADNAAFFIFTNWDEYGNNSPRSILHDLSNADLVNALVRSNGNTRILLSSIAKMTKNEINTFEASYPPFEVWPVVDPVFPQIIRYNSSLDFPEKHGPFLSGMQPLLGRKQVPGAHLMIIILLLELGDEIEKLQPESCLSKVKECIEEYAQTIGVGKVVAREGKIELARPMVRLLIDLLYELDLFHILMAIGASDDGLRLASLSSVINDWKDQTGETFKRAGKEEESLEMLSQMAGGFFVKRLKPANHNPHQFEKHEKVDSTSPQWELNQTLRELILREIFDAEWPENTKNSYRVIAWQAHRLVSKLAYRRAQNWRSYAHLACLSRNWRDMLPDIQSYEGLLASLNPDDFDTELSHEDIVQRSKGLCEMEQPSFSMTENHCGITGMRFAVFCLLKNKIDMDSRLTMQFDKDMLRTRLYLLPFLEIGRKFLSQFDTMSLNALPKEIPKQISKSFSIEEQIELLETIAISAFHSQSSLIIRWTWQQFNELVKNTTDDKVRSSRIYKGSRIVCTLYDMGILCGGPIENTKLNGTHRDSIEALKRFLVEHFPDFENGNIHRLPIANVCGQKSAAIAWLRLKSREAELLGILGEGEAAIQMYQIIHEIEGNLKSIIPPVLSGRPARSAINTYLRAIASNPEGENAIKFERVEQMLSTNTNRLSRFGGAEQVGLLLDKAQFLAAQKNGSTTRVEEFLKRALVISNEAKNKAEHYRVSLGVRLQAMESYVKIFLELEEVRGQQSRCLTDTEKKNVDEIANDINLLQQMAEALKFTPKVGVARFFRAKVLHLFCDPGELTKLKSEGYSASEEISDAQKIMDSCLNTSYQEEIKSLHDQIVP